MSIYCSTFSVDADEHTKGCKRLVRLKRGQKAPRDKDGIARFVIAGAQSYAVDDSRPCTCGSGPLVYQHSGVLPSDKDERGGCFGIAAIPNHITRDGRDDRPENGKWYPWLRVSMDDCRKDALILTRAQVEELRNALNGWLERTNDCGPAARTRDTKRKRRKRG